MVALEIGRFLVAVFEQALTRGTSAQRGAGPGVPAP
jgi:hypothetical protein